MNTTAKGFSVLLVVLGAVVALISLGGFYYYFSVFSKEDKNIQKNPSQQVNIKSEDKSTTGNTERSVFGELSSNKNNNVSVTDCGNDLKCLIQASINCRPAKVTNSVTIDSFGIKQTTITYYEIKGYESDKCLIYLKTQKVTVELPASVSQEIDDQQSELYKKLEGRDGQCSFNTKDLTEILTKWEKGNFDSGTAICKLTPNGNACTAKDGDFASATCAGRYFENSF